MSDFYRGQIFYGAVKKQRKVMVLKLLGEDLVNQVFYFEDKATGKKYKVKRYYLGRSVFLSEDNARLAAGLRRKSYFPAKSSKKKKTKRREYPQRMYERYERKPNDYRPQRRLSYEDTYFGQRATQNYKDDD